MIQNKISIETLLKSKKEEEFKNLTMMAINLYIRLIV